MRRAAWLTLALLVAGCQAPRADTDDAASPTSTGGALGVAEFDDSYETARLRAGLWDAGALLVVALASEPSSEGLAERAPDRTGGQGWSLAQTPDPVPGDGLAQAWAYEFSARARPGTSYVVIVDAEGHVTEEFEPVPGQWGQPFGEPMQPWSTGSAQAADAAYRDYATWRTTIDEPGREVIMTLTAAFNETLGQAAGTPDWFLISTSKEPPKIVRVVVDAQTGETIRVATE